MMRRRAYAGLWGAMVLGVVSWTVQGIPVKPDPPLASQDAMLDRADRLESQGRYAEALQIYERLIQDGGGRDLRWTAHLFFRQACAQYQTGDRLTALETAEAAVTLDPGEPAYKTFLVELQAERSVGARTSPIRLRRDRGSARRLTATNGVLHLLVRGRNSDYWDDEEIEKLRRHVAETDRWVVDRSSESAVSPPPMLIHRYLILPDEPFWRRNEVPDATSTGAYRKAWFGELLQRFQSSSFAELFDRVFEGMDLDNRSVIFHLSQRQDSFAILAPFQRQPTDLESVFVFTDRSEWITGYETVAYLHEWLHVYGAEDFFNTVSDPGIPENDIMKFGAHRLEGCVLSPLTRYAIGWTDQPPRLQRLRWTVEPISTAKGKKGGRG